MGDVNSIANSFPTDGRVVKAIVYQALAWSRASST